MYIWRANCITFLMHECVGKVNRWNEVTCLNVRMITKGHQSVLGKL